MWSNKYNSINSIKIELIRCNSVNGYKISSENALISRVLQGANAKILLGDSHVTVLPDSFNQMK